VLGETEYADVRFASFVAGTTWRPPSFHPEKSGHLGLQVLKNFTTWKRLITQRDYSG